MFLFVVLLFKSFFSFAHDPTEYKILKIYLTHRWDPNKYYHFNQSRVGSNGNEGGTP